LPACPSLRSFASYDEDISSLRGSNQEPAQRDAGTTLRDRRLDNGRQCELRVHVTKKRCCSEHSVCEGSATHTIDSFSRLPLTYQEPAANVHPPVHRLRGDLGVAPAADVQARRPQRRVYLDRTHLQASGQQAADCRLGLAWCPGEHLVRQPPPLRSRQAGKGPRPRVGIWFRTLKPTLKRSVSPRVVEVD